MPNPVVQVSKSGRLRTGVRVPLVLVGDDAYAMPLATALRSIVEADRSGESVVVYVLCHDLKDSSRERIERSVPPGSVVFNWIPVGLAQFANFATSPHISKTTYARLLMPTVLPETVSRALYLDADILVIGELWPLQEANIEGFVIGAVLDGLDARIKAGESGYEALPRVRDYFNAGVLLIDLERWRQERISETAFEYLTEHPESPLADQDALNFACDGVWKQLDSRWNFQDHYETRISKMVGEQQPRIVHFIMRFKPWKASVLNPNAKLYDSVRSRTRFARTNTDKIADMLQAFWWRTKRFLKHYPLIRGAWDFTCRVR